MPMTTEKEIECKNYIHKHKCDLYQQNPKNCLTCARAKYHIDFDKVKSNYFSKDGRFEIIYNPNGTTLCRWIVLDHQAPDYEKCRRFTSTSAEAMEYCSQILQGTVQYQTTISEDDNVLRLLEHNEISVRTYNVLRRNNIHTLKELTYMTKKEVSKLQHCGNAVMKEIENCLKTRNLKFTTEDENIIETPEQAAEADEHKFTILRQNIYKLGLSKGDVLREVEYVAKYKDWTYTALTGATEQDLCRAAALMPNMTQEDAMKIINHFLNRSQGKVRDAIEFMLEQNNKEPDATLNKILTNMNNIETVVSSGEQAYWWRKGLNDGANIVKSYLSGKDNNQNTKR